MKSMDTFLQLFLTTAPLHVFLFVIPYREKEALLKRRLEGEERARAQVRVGSNSLQTLPWKFGLVLITLSSRRSTHCQAQAADAKKLEERHEKERAAVRHQMDVCQSSVERIFIFIMLHYWPNANLIFL